MLFSREKEDIRRLKEVNEVGEQKKGRRPGMKNLRSESAKVGDHLQR